MKNKIAGILVCILFVGTTIIPITNGINEKKFTDINQTFFANIFYVDDDSLPPGNGSLNWPYSEIQYAIDNASSDYTIIVYPGKYENIFLNNKNKITIEGTNKTNVPFTIIDGENKDKINVIDIRDAGDITISNFTITGSGQNYDEDSYNYDGIYINNVYRLIINNNTITGNGNGINLQSMVSGSIYIIYNVIKDNLDNGIRANHVQSLQIEKNSIQHNGYGPGTVKKNGDGIESMSLSSCFNIINNNISYNKVDGIWIETGDSNKILNNEIYGNEQAGIDLKEVSNSKILNNKIRGGKMKNQSSGIFLRGSSSENTISNNTIYNNRVGINLWNTQNNHITDSTNSNIIRNNYLGLKLYQVMGDEITHNLIKDNTIGFQILISFGFKINNNDIYPGLSLFSLVSYGDAMMNYWGVPGRPSTRMIRILSLIIISPWSPFPFFPEYSSESYGK